MADSFLPIEGRNLSKQGVFAGVHFTSSNGSLCSFIRFTFVTFNNIENELLDKPFSSRAIGIYHMPILIKLEI